MINFFTITLALFFSLESHAKTVDPEIVSRIRKNNRTFKLLNPLMAHPRRAGKRDAHQVYYPTNYHQKEKWPLVVLLHGIYVSGDFQDHFFGLKKRASKQGFVLVIPGSTYDQNGVRFWNAGTTCCDYFDSKVDDVAELEKLIQKIKKEERIDPEKISVVGHSNGAMMAQRLACDTENLITKVVSYAGVMDTGFTCKNKSPFTLILNHDLNDQRILYDGMSDEELNYRTQNNLMYPLKSNYTGAEENYKQWQTVLPRGSVELITTVGKGHMPKLSKKEKTKLADFVIK